MTKNLWAIAALLVASGVAHATNFTFSYSSPNGTSLVVDGSLIASPDGANVYTVTDVSGTYDVSGKSYNIVDIAGNNGAFTYANGTGTGSFDFLVQFPTYTQLEILVFGSSGFYIEDSVGNTLYAGTNFTITDPPPSTSEAGTLSLLSSMSLGAFALARKLLSKSA